MSDTVKLIIEIPKITYEDLRQGKIYSSLCEAPQRLIEGIRNGTPLDSNSERAEVQAYFDGEAYGWEQGRKALIDDVKAEIEKEIIPRNSDDYDHDVMYQNCGLRIALKIIDNAGKAESEESE